MIPSLLPAMQFLPVKGIVNALNELEAAYGSAEEYLKGPIGMTDSDIQTLRERYLV